MVYIYVVNKLIRQKMTAKNFKLINIAIDDWEALRKIASDNSRSMAKQIRAWIKEYKEKQSATTTSKDSF